ncbi:unnamed protein product [Darwinula stevensoni]|uniref:RNA 3'-terminal phosphate cyclase n=1 Tax=Darwinula stevensoni TaxID=69355 RepID=A0A7R9ABJ1_9CRUS|nr:unnamed protein product [Darwinula stevensoni]CAG0899107.1 unnamed protein product [Darwinula stevensoni]
MTDASSQSFGMDGSTEKVTSLDGSYMEGGGQILRMGMALGAILRKPVRVYNIRAGRPNPGLQAQHLTGIQLVKQICNGCLIGDQIGSTEITLYPESISHGNFHGDTKTAGSVGLLLQVALPCLAFAQGSSTLILKGGTNADFAPQIDYTLEIFKPLAKKFGLDFSCNVIQR